MSNISTVKLYPLLFKPIYVEIMWGGNLLKDYFSREVPKTDGPIAEAWEISDRPGAESIIENGDLKDISIRQLMEIRGKDFIGNSFIEGERFPLLVKLIDAGRRLSLQVHPDEEACKRIEGAEPKTEMWFIIAAKENAKIIAGLQTNCTKMKFLDNISSDAIVDCLQTFKSEPGDAYFINAGTVHSIGAGNLLLEIQQNSNTTYRLSDWGRVGLDGKPRELHVDKALECINFLDRSSPRITAPSNHVPRNRKFPVVNKCPYFSVDDMKLTETLIDSTKGEHLHLITPIDSGIEIEYYNNETIYVERGCTCAIPAVCGRYNINIGDTPEVTVIKTSLK